MTDRYVYKGLRKLLIEEIESGKHQEGDGWTLRQGESFSVQGVMCEIYRRNNPSLARWVHDEFMYDDHPAPILMKYCAPYPVMEWYGMHEIHIVQQRGETVRFIVDLNHQDGPERYTFEQFAKALREIDGI